MKRARGHLLVPAVATVLVALATGAPTLAQSAAPTDNAGPIQPPPPTLTGASQLEKFTMNKLIVDPSWARRAIAAMRLERFACDESRDMLIGLLSDEAWQVRCFAARTLGRRRVPAADDWFVEETNPRVLRAALRHRYALDPERLARGVNYLARSTDPDQRLLAAELGAASGNEELHEQATELVRTIITRMQRAEAGAISPRLAVLTGQYGNTKPRHWLQWMRRSGRKRPLRTGITLPAGDEPMPPSHIAGLSTEQFAALEAYMESLADRKVDLALCIDCTASMYGELSEVQGGMNDLMMFVGDAVDSLRVGIVAYRDRRDDFETKGWDFTSDIDKARTRLWKLSASGGGDTAESVYPAMQFAYSRLSWREESSKVLILIGDARPHPGDGARCISLARQFLEHEVIVNAIQTENKPVKHFPEIAETGAGKCIDLEDDRQLMPEIAGLTLGERFRDELLQFFDVYLELCR